MAGIDKVYDALNEYAQEMAGELAAVEGQIADAQEVADGIREAYVLLLGMDHRKEWPARLTTEGQHVLCHLRDALADLTGRDIETVQVEAEEMAAHRKYGKVTP